MMGKMKFLALLGALFMAGPATPAEQDAPEDVIITMVNDVMDRLRAQRPALEANPERVYEMINELIVPGFDFVSMSRWILGKQWKMATEEQRDVFVRQFKNLLVRSYGKALLGVTEERVNHIETRPSSKPGIVQVMTEIVLASGTQSVPVNYIMRDSGAGWKVINVSFEGVSLVETYRQSFASEIRNNGLDALLQKLADKNEKLSRAVAG